MSNILILGGGVSGKAAALLAEKLGDTSVILNDGENTFLPEGGDLIVASPGVHPLRSGLYKAALDSGKEFIGELEYGFRHFKGRTVAVTGTNGKTTTTELTVFLLRAAGVDAVAAGNIGLPLSAVAAQEKQPGTVVIEVSSFQLELAPSFAPSAAALLNLESDHEDRYAGGFAEYCAVKGKIFDKVPSCNQIWGLSFADKPRRVTFENEMLCIDGKALFDVRETALSAPHNRENLAAAVELFLRLEPDKVQVLPEAVKKFRCGSHRIELFCESGGVRFYDDSKGTNPAAVAAAVDSVQGRIVLLAGGLDKGMDFSLFRTFVPRLRSLVVYGRCRDRIAEIFSGSGVKITSCGMDFEKAVSAAVADALPGDAVMLSPGCASMDMFKNYQERGDRFKELVLQRVKGSRSGEEK